VVDDDGMSRNVVKHYIQKTKFLRQIGEFESAISANNFLHDEHVDIIFLDIQMPEMSGMDLVKSLEYDHEVVLISSVEKYALEAFEQHVTDYLLKPVDYTRFLLAAQKAKSNIENSRKSIAKRREFYVRTDSKMVRIALDSIWYVEALADYVIIKTKAKSYIVHYTMKGLESRLPQDTFIRIHRSYIINLDFIELLEDNSVAIGEKLIPIGASFREALMNRLNFL
jgi:DNA-binding LytR/AlgR family response regulator